MFEGTEGAQRPLSIEAVDTPARLRDPPHILHVITDMSAGGGAEVMLARILRKMGDSRQSVASLMTVSPVTQNLAGNAGVEYHALGLRGAQGFPGAILNLAALMRRKRPTIVMAWLYHAMIAGSLAAMLSRPSPPVIWNVRQALDDEAAMSRSTRLAMGLAARLSRRADGILYNSDRALRQHEARGYATDRSIVIPNGIALPARSQPPQQIRHFGVAARFHPQKDFPSLFAAAAEAFRDVPDAELVIAGPGIDGGNGALAALIADAGLPRERVHLRGAVTDMDGFYRGIDALVLASRTEGFPNVVLEAMSHGRPALSTDVGDARRLVGETGWIVPPQSPEALAAAMREMAAMQPADIAARSAAARERVAQHYAIDRIVEQYRQVLRVR